MADGELDLSLNDPGGLQEFGASQGGLQDFAAGLPLGSEVPSLRFDPRLRFDPGPGAPPAPTSPLDRFAAGLGKEFDTPLKAFGQLLGLGATGLGFANQLGVQRALGRQTQTLERGQQAAQAAAAPAVGFGQRTLASAEAGQLPPPMEAAVAQWVQQAKADMRARLAQMGLGNSTDLQSFEAQIDQMALAMKAQLLQGQEGTALEALQTGVSAGTGVSQSAQNQQALLANLIQAANQQLGRLSGSQA